MTHRDSPGRWFRRQEVPAVALLLLAAMLLVAVLALATVSAVAGAMPDWLAWWALGFVIYDLVRFLVQGLLRTGPKKLVMVWSCDRCGVTLGISSHHGRGVMDAAVRELDRLHGDCPLRSGQR